MKSVRSVFHLRPFSFLMRRIGIWQIDTGPFNKTSPIPLALLIGECDFASRTWRADANRDKMVKLDLRDSELRAVSDSEGNYSV
jgi:hypothetical protein